MLNSVVNQTAGMQNSYCSNFSVILSLACMGVVSAPDLPALAKKKKRKESARRGSGAVNTEGLNGM